ncbi:MAG: hypothetical protein E1N59_1185 [Puniceicoccaceae bacterium 5H]|nr:MAG: hypothetical protein E1N59_1185 [Puniceicoccaceae bacterium 5H]
MTYVSRPISALPFRRLAGFELKIYRITPQNQTFDWDAFSGGLKAAQPMLQQAAQALGEQQRLGFAIAHPSSTGQPYLTLAWWGNGNELFIRVLVMNEKGKWVEDRDRHSFCVWDLEVIWFERNAFLECMLQPQPEAERYLRLQLHKNV